MLATDKSCIPCWLRAQRQANSSVQINKGVIDQVGEPAPSTSQATENSIQAEQPSTSTKQEPLRTVSPTVPEEAITSTERSGSIKPACIALPTLRRAADTSRRCIFMKCNDQEKRTVPITIRKIIIKDFHFYIPPNARICNFHLTSNLFHELYNDENALSMFTAEHIEEIVFLLSEDNSIDFHNPEKLDDHLFKYWFGRTKSEYNQILADVPRLKVPHIKCGLNALLCKMHTGDSNERIAALFKMPRRTLEGNMSTAGEILNTYPII